MIHELLRRSEHSPGAVFTHDDLTRRDQNAFAELRTARLLRRTDGGDGGVIYRDGRRLRVVESDDGLEAIDEDDPTFEAFRISPETPTRWRLDVGRWAQAFAKHHNLAGTPEPTSHFRVHHLGELEQGTSVNLALVGNERQLAGLLDALPRLVPPHLVRHVLVCPTFAPPLTQLAELRSRSVTFARLGGDGLAVNPDLGECLARLARPARLPDGRALTPEQRAEAERWSLKVCVPIHFSGIVVRSKRNELFVNGVRLELQENYLKGLLRFAVALFEEEGGWLSREQLQAGEPIEDEKVFFVPPHIDQWKSRLLALVQGAVSGPLIEAGDRRLRLSTHPALVSADVDQLARHPDATIASLGARLSAYAERGWAVSATGCLRYGEDRDGKAGGVDRSPLLVAHGDAPALLKAID